MQKSNVLKAIVKERKERIEESEKELEKIRDEMFEAPGFKSTSPENDKKMFQRRATEIEKAISRHREVIDELGNLAPNFDNTVRLWALVAIKGLEAEGTYLIVPKAEIFPACLKIEGQEIRFISAKSPVGQRLIGLRRGEKITFRQELEVISID